MIVQKLVKLAAASVLGVFVFPSLAAAENAHVYHGSQCKSAFGEDSGQINSHPFGLRNLTTDTFVTCPLVVDETDNITGTTRVFVHFTGTDDDRFHCTLYSLNGGGFPRQSVSNYRYGTGWMSFSNITSDDYYGSYAMVCALPSGGVINTIWVGEKN